MDQAFKQLQDHWYRKLKSHGFDDIEDTNSPREFLKFWSSSFKSKYTPDQFREKHRYFQMTVHFTRTHEFTSGFEERVWCLHSEGFSLREIAAQLNSNKDKVNKIVLSLTKKMRGY